MNFGLWQNWGLGYGGSGQNTPTLDPSPTLDRSMSGILRGRFFTDPLGPLCFVTFIRNVPPLACDRSDPDGAAGYCKNESAE